MNGRTSKQLRAAAQRATTGQPDRVYEVRTVTRAMWVPSKDPRGKPELVDVPRYQLVLGKCTRRLYKQLKRYHKTGVIREAQA